MANNKVQRLDPFEKKEKQRFTIRPIENGFLVSQGFGDKEWFGSSLLEAQKIQTREMKKVN